MEPAVPDIEVNPAGPIDLQGDAVGSPGVWVSGTGSSRRNISCFNPHPTLLEFVTEAGGPLQLTVSNTRGYSRAYDATRVENTLYFTNVDLPFSSQGPTFLLYVAMRARPGAPQSGNLHVTFNAAGVNSNSGSISIVG
jgi:hypothetical protein